MADLNKVSKQSTQNSIYDIKEKANLKSKGRCSIKNKGPYKFVIKLKELLSYEHISDAISWNLDGTIVEIRDEQRFTNEVLPMFFKINTLSNFIRQLNLYRFKKIRNYSIKNAKAYLNPAFKRDSHDLSKITRASQKKKLVKLDEVEKIMKISVRKIRNLNKKLVSLKKKQTDNSFACQELQQNLKEMDSYSDKLESILSILIHYSTGNNIHLQPHSSAELCSSILDILRYNTEESEQCGALQSNSDLSQYTRVIQSTSFESNNELTANIGKPAIEKDANISFSTTNSSWENLKLRSSDSFKIGNESLNNIAALQHEYLIEQEFIDYFLSN